MGLRSFVASLSGAWLTLDLVDLDDNRLEGRFYVPPPTVRAALGLFAIVEGIEAGHRSEIESFRRISIDWLGPEIGEFLFSRNFPFEKASSKVLELLSLGYEKKETYTEDLDELETQARETSWQSILADYRYAYKSNDPLSETWTFFLSQFAEIPRLRARDQHSFIVAYAALKGEDIEKAIGEIFKTAYPNATIEKKYAHLNMPELTDEWIQKQIEIAKRNRETR
jgi:hypothetical protein